MAPPPTFLLGEPAKRPPFRLRNEVVLDPQLVNFVRSSLRSIWALEFLLYLRRAAPDARKIEDIVRDLRATRFLVRRLTQQLVSEGLAALEPQDHIRFHAATPDHERLCELLDVASRDRPIALRDVIASAPNDKLRSLADAFRFKEKKEEE
jgi:hypothetical protein